MEDLEKQLLGWNTISRILSISQSLLFIWTSVAVSVVVSFSVGFRSPLLRTSPQASILPFNISKPIRGQDASFSPIGISNFCSHVCHAESKTPKSACNDVYMQMSECAPSFDCIHYRSAVQFVYRPKLKALNNSEYAIGVRFRSGAAYGWRHSSFFHDFLPPRDAPHQCSNCQALK